MDLIDELGVSILANPNIQSLIAKDKISVHEAAKFSSEKRTNINQQLKYHPDTENIQPNKTSIQWRYIYYKADDVSFLQNVAKDYSLYYPNPINGLGLSDKPPADLIARAAALIPPSIQYFDIQKCSLGEQRNHKHLDKIFESIPRTVIAINMDFNHLELLTAEQLQQAFSKIPSGVQTITLEYNGLNDEQIQAIMHAIPEHVEFVTFEAHNPIRRSEWLEKQSNPSSTLNFGIGK